MQTDTSQSVTLSASDLDADTLTFSATGLPLFAGLADLGDGTATLTLNPATLDIGVYSITVSVSDGLLSDSQVLELTVQNEPPPANNAPVLNPIAMITVQEDATQQVVLSATDPDGHALSYSAVGLPGFASLTDLGDNTALLDVSPSVGQLGSYSLTVTVSDGDLSASQVVQLVVEEKPAPVYGLIYSLTADRAGQLPLADAVVAGDLFARLSPETGDIDRVYFYLDGSSSYFESEGSAPFDIQGGGSSANPFDTTDLADGLHSIRTEVQLGSGETVFAETFFTVANVAPPPNRAPVLNTINAVLMQTNTSQSVTVSASDLDADALTFSAAALPAFATLTDLGDGTATLALNPATLDIGVYSITVTVSDGLLFDSQVVTITITSSDPSAGSVRINEFMASNVSTLADGDGDFEDWIEIHNYGADPVDLTNWCLTDDVSNPALWCFPSGTLLAGEYMLVFASKKDPAPAGEVHIGLKLGAGGEYLALVKPDGTIASEFAPTFPAQTADVSFGINPAGELNYFSTPTPVAVNETGTADALVFDTAALNFNVTVGDGVSTAQSIVSSLSGALTEYSLSVDDGGAGWLAALALGTDDGLTPDTTEITINPATLAEGVYIGSVSATAAGASSATLSITLTVGAAGAPEALLEISEFMASNASTLADGDGDFEDWIEIHNYGADPVDLTNWCLTDDVSNPALWCFPSGTLLAGEYMLVFASKKDPAPAGEVHIGLKLGAGGEYLALVKPDGTIASEFAPTFPAQTADVSFGINPAGELNYFSTPTPNEINNEGVEFLGNVIVVSHDRGFHSLPFMVEISTNSAVDSIIYTTDGSQPTLSNGLLYTGSPVNIETTTILRVAVFTDGNLADRVATYSYIFPADVIKQPAVIDGYPNGSYSVGSSSAIHDYEMDPEIVYDLAYSSEMIAAMESIPTMSIAVNPDEIFGGTGFYDGDEEEKAVSIEILYANDPVSNHQANAGIESHSHKRMKRSLRLNFRSIYGDSSFNSDLLANAPLNGDTAFGKYDKLILRAGNNRCWCRQFNPDETAYTIDQFYRDTQIEATGAGARGTFVHLYINGLYWGMYNTVERADKHFLSDYFGGDKDDWFSANHGLVHDNAPPLSGDDTRYNYLTGTLLDLDMTDPSVYADFQNHLDTASFIDYMLINWWAGVGDWPDNNWYAGNRNATSPEGSTGLMYFAWDGEWAWDANTDFDNPGERAEIHPLFRSDSDVSDFSNDPTGSYIIAKIWHAARQNADFMAAFQQRTDELLGAGGALSDEAASARWTTLNNFISTAVIAESARWGDTITDIPKTRDGDWQSEVDKIAGLLNGNAAVLKARLIEEGYYIP